MSAGHAVHAVRAVPRGLDPTHIYPAFQLPTTNHRACSPPTAHHGAMQALTSGPCAMLISNRVAAAWGVRASWNCSRPNSRALLALPCGGGRGPRLQAGSTGRWCRAGSTGQGAWLPASVLCTSVRVCSLHGAPCRPPPPLPPCSGGPRSGPSSLRGGAGVRGGAGLCPTHPPHRPSAWPGAPAGAPCRRPPVPPVGVQHTGWA